MASIDPATTRAAAGVTTTGLAATWVQRPDRAPLHHARTGGCGAGGGGRTCTQCSSKTPRRKASLCHLARGVGSGTGPYINGAGGTCIPVFRRNRPPHRQAPRRRAAPSLVPLVVRGLEDHRGGATGCGHRPQLRAAQVMPRITLRFPGRRLGVPRPWGSCGTIPGRTGT